MKDPIERQTAIEALMAWEEDSIWDEECLKHRGEPYWISPSDVVENLPSAQPERLTNDDFETIRIHLSAYKEKLCNQRRWKEAEEYQRIIDRFIAFATAQPEIIRCKDCKHYDDGLCRRWKYSHVTSEDSFCSGAERRNGWEE